MCLTLVQWFNLCSQVPVRAWGTEQYLIWRYFRFGALGAGAMAAGLHAFHPLGAGRWALVTHLKAPAIGPQRASPTPLRHSDSGAVVAERALTDSHVCALWTSDLSSSSIVHL